MAVAPEEETRGYSAGPKARLYAVSPATMPSLPA